MHPNYRHTQIGTLSIVTMGLALLVLGGLLLKTNFNPVGGITFLILALCQWIFSAMTIEVDEHQVKVSLGAGIGLIRRSFRLEEIRSVAKVRNPLYYGWGIKFIPHGLLYNVSGRGAVELQMRDGRVYRIGTNQPDELAGAIEKVL